jgi:adenosylhomocysteinase
MMEWGKEVGPDLIVDDGGDATLLVHLGMEWEEKYNATGELPKPEDGTCEDEHELFRVIKDCILSSETKSYFKNMCKNIKGVSEETTTGVHRLL